MELHSILDKDEGASEENQPEEIEAVTVVVKESCLVA